MSTDSGTFLYGAHYHFEINLQPGEGTFIWVFHNGISRIMRHILADTTIGGQDSLVVIDSLCSVASGATLTILPGTTIVFLNDSALTVDGRLYAVGKEDTTITFISLTPDPIGQITLAGTSTDSLQYCNILQLNTGVKVSKVQTDKVWINNCSFEENANEGVNVTSGTITIENSSFTKNKGDGAYLYNCTATIDSSYFEKNDKNGLYMNFVNSSSVIKASHFKMNGAANGSYSYGGVYFYNCSPYMEKSTATLSYQYGLYGGNGAYPVLYNTGYNAANTISGNQSHETYWDASYPFISYGHNNFNVEDDTLIYITNSSITSFYAYGNYWGGGPPNTGTPSSSYYGPGVFYYSNHDTVKQVRVHDDNDRFDPSDTKGGDDFIIADNEEDALDVFLEAFDLENAEPLNAIDGYRDLIAEFPETSIATICIDRILWLVRSNYTEHSLQRELGGILVYFNRLSQNEDNHDLAWKARRARLWALAALHRYEEAISGFEEIVRNPDSFADSVYAVIDIGTLHLEAEEWERRNDDGERRDAVIGFGSMPQLCPTSFPVHRVHTDELLALLGSVDAQGRPTIPTEYFLAQNYPNPFNSMTRIQFGLPKATHVKIKIYDIMGREVITLVDTDMKAGYYTNVWKGRNKDNVPISSGMYFYQIKAGNYLKTKKMILVK